MPSILGNAARPYTTQDGNMKNLWLVAYIAAIVAVNYGFSITQPLNVFGVFLPPMTFLVGAIFVIRDYAQRANAPLIWPAMLVGCAINWWMASPDVAIASAVAFLFSEALDWLIFTITKRPLRDRILWSSAVATPLDSIVFLAMIGHFAIWPVVVMTVSKMLASVFTWAALRARA